MAGVQNVVAPQGTAFTEQHARIIKRYVNEVVLCFDSDEAGQNAAVRSLDHLLASGLAVRVAVVPAPHDPDSFIKANGGDAFRKLVENAEGFFDYYLNRLCVQNDVNSDKGRFAILRAMAEAVHKSGSAVLVDTYAQKTALRLGVSPEAVRSEFKKNPTVKAAPIENKAEPAVEPESPRPSAQEFWLLKLLLLHENLAGWAALHLDMNWIQNSLARKIVALRLAAQTNESWQNLAVFLNECETPELRNLVTEVAAEDRAVPNPEQQLHDVVKFLRNQFLDRQITSSIQRLSQPQMGDAEKIELLREQQKLREQKRASLSPLN
jgi:DNA primase